VVLSRNTLSKVDTTEDKVTMLDNKVNWLFALEIASVGVMVLFGLIGLFGFMRYKTCA
jgi:hypothetical protein